MANLRGWVAGDQGAQDAPHLANQYMVMQAETREGAVRVHLRSDGEFAVYIGEKGDARQAIVYGNVDRRTWTREIRR